jgi:hypothetical protein
MKSAQGSAMVESAILFPVMILLVMFSAAMTDVMVLKLKSAEALRYALWENTVFKSPAQISGEVQTKFADLKSPRSINSTNTDLMMYPLARDLTWSANIDTTSKNVGIGGSRITIPGGFWSQALASLINALSGTVDTVTRIEGFNMHGEATVSVALTRAHHDPGSMLLQGGDLVGRKGQNDLGTPGVLQNFTLNAPLGSERPMTLIFDTWKAWPKPAMYANGVGSTDVTMSPMKTYPAVETQVAEQTKKIAFFGLTGFSFFNSLNNIMGQILGAGITTALLGGQLPLIFSADRMDGPNAGPITILPVGVPTESWAPSQCQQKDGSMQKCGNQRVGGMVVSSTTPKYMGANDSMGTNVDATRYTVPYRLNSRYWKRSGGVGQDTADSASVQNLPAAIATTNDYVKSWNCRGHFFGGSQKSQITDRTQRYSGFNGTCP